MVILNIRKIYSANLILLIFGVVCFARAASEEMDSLHEPGTLRDGYIRHQENKHLEAWDSVGNRWLSIESFWDHYGARRGGITWGSRTEYPPYSKVKELDTMIINLPTGACMMEFFHGRWRRANNVRRWSKEFDEYGGCPYVFD